MKWRTGHSVAAPWTRPVSLLFSGGAVFLAAEEDNETADLSCGHKSCQLAANKPKTVRSD